MVSKHGYLILPSGAFLDKVTPDNDFADEAVVRCDVLFAKRLF